MANDKVVAWMKAARLRTLPLSFSVILVGSGMAYSIMKLASSQKEFNWIVFTLTLTTTLFLQVLSNFANDYGDALKGADNADRIGPERAIQSGAISPQQMKLGIIIVSLLSLISGVLLLLVSFEGKLDWTFFVLFIIGLLSIAAAIKYTVGKGAYGYYAFGDLGVFIFFGIVGVCGTFYLQTEFLNWTLFIWASSFGALCVAVLNLNNMRDRLSDEKVGKRTLAVLLGLQGSKIYHLLLFVIAWWPFVWKVVVSSSRYGLIFLWTAPILVFHIIHLIKVMKTQDPKNFDPELKKIALSTFLLAALLFFISLS